MPPGPVAQAWSGQQRHLELGVRFPNAALSQRRPETEVGSQLERLTLSVGTVQGVPGSLGWRPALTRLQKPDVAASMAPGHQQGQGETQKAGVSECEHLGKSWQDLQRLWQLYWALCSLVAKSAESTSASKSFCFSSLFPWGSTHLRFAGLGWVTSWGPRTGPLLFLPW